MTSDRSGSPRPLSTAEEIRLVSCAKRGDVRSFEELVERYMGRAIHVAMGYVRNRDDAADLAQETFLRVHRSFARFRDGEPFAPWFFKILRNACLNFLERRKKRRATSLDARHEDGNKKWDLPDEGTLTPDRRAELNEAQRAFWNALDDLSDAHREIILLRHVQDLEYAEIAEILEIPVGTVMSRLFHARRRLRGLLDKHVQSAPSQETTR